MQHNSTRKLSMCACACVTVCVYVCVCVCVTHPAAVLCPPFGEAGEPTDLRYTGAQGCQETHCLLGWRCGGRQPQLVLIHT